MIFYLLESMKWRSWSGVRTGPEPHMKECCMVGQHADSAAGYCASKARSCSANIVIHLHVFNSQAYPNRNKTADAREGTFHRQGHMTEGSSRQRSDYVSGLEWVNQKNIDLKCADFQQLTCVFFHHLFTFGAFHRLQRDGGANVLCLHF